MEQGWVYVLLNSSLPGMAKVGRTSRAPPDRAAELSAASGVPTPFVVAFQQSFEDCCVAERQVHDELDRRGLRVMSNREFFHGSSSDIIRVVMDAAGTGGDGAPLAVDRSIPSLLMAGDRFLYGIGDTLQDSGEAVRCYRLAASRGSLIAFERLGQIYTGLYVRRNERASRRRALSPLKEGARRGNYYCYAEMGVLFAGERHTENFVKAWNMFFSGREDYPLAEIESGPERMAVACCRYISTSLELRMQPAHGGAMLPVAGDVVAVLLSEMALVRTDPPARQQVAETLRWAFENLLPGMSGPARLRERLFGQSRRRWLASR